MSLSLKIALLCWLCLGGRAAGGVAVPGSDLVSEAVLETREDIARDTEALNRLRDALAEERKPLAAEMEMLQKRVASLREESSRIARQLRRGEEELDFLLAETKSLEEESRYLLTLFTEYARARQTRVGPAEAHVSATHMEPFRSVAARETPFDGMSRWAGQGLSQAADWNATRVGGYQFEGVALDAGGIEHKGRFAVFGPTAYFVASGGSPAGLVVTQFGADQPSIYKFPSPGEPEAILGVLAGDEAVLPLDVTLGDALRLEAARTTVIEHLRKGGLVMLPLLAVGLLALVLSIWKTLDLARMQVRGDASARRALLHVRDERRDGALRQPHPVAGEPLASLAAFAVRHRSAPREHLEELMHEQVLGCLPRFERHLGALAVLGGVAPLLGLLGTVTGMIRTFQLVTIFGTGDARFLSGGISEALVTTQFGLAVAIPVLLAHAFLARRARNLMGVLEDSAAAMVNDLKPEINQP